MHSLRDTHSHSRFNSFSERSSSRQVNALALDPGVVSLNALEATLDLSSERSITNYAIHGLRIGSQHGTHLDDIRLLSNFINTVATNVCNNNPRFFDTSRPCAVCNRTGHTFDDCPLLQNKEEVTLAYTRIVSALRRLLPSMGANATNANDLASSLSRPSASSSNDNLLQALAASVVATNDKVDSLLSTFSSVNATSATIQDTDDDDSVSTTATDDSIKALRSYLSSGFRFR